MLDELQRRNYSPNTVRFYVHAIENFARYFRRCPEQLGPNHIRENQIHLFRDRRLSPRTIEGRTAALRFLFVKTLRRPYLPDAIPFPKQHKRLPTVLSQEEASRLIDSTGNLMHRAMVMTLYATGIRRAELCRPKVADIVTSAFLPTVDGPHRCCVAAACSRPLRHYNSLLPQLRSSVRSAQSPCSSSNGSPAVNSLLHRPDPASIALDRP
jgi:site-specific recombinase XerD